MTQITTMLWSLSDVECEVKWALGSITMKEARVGDGILKQLSYF